MLTLHGFAQVVFNWQMQNEQHSIPATLQQQALVVQFLQLQLSVSLEVGG